MAALTAMRLLVAAMVPLTPDETYYWVWSRALAAGYLDHPPMVALWIRAGTLLAGQTELGVRLLGPLAAALASWFLFDAARRLFPDRRNAGAAAVILLNGTLLLGVGTVIITPDSPLLFFWTATLWAMVRLIKGGAAGWWLVAGLCAGLALDSKYTALFLWIGIGLWLLAVPSARPWLRRWQPWAALVLGACVFAPVVVWNAEHGWAGFLRQGGRVGDWQPVRAIGFLAELVGGQIGLATPWIWWLCMAGLAASVRYWWTQRDPGWSLLAALSVPPVLVFVQHAIGDRVQGNWPAILYPAAALAASGLIRPRPHASWIGASALGFGISVVVYLQAAIGLFPLPPGMDPIGLRMTGWDRFARAVEATREQAGAAYVVADGYATASELAWWLPSDLLLVGMDTRWDLTALPAAVLPQRPGILLRDARRSDAPDPAIWLQAEAVAVLSRGPTHFLIYEVTAATIPRVAVVLPQRP